MTKIEKAVKKISDLYDFYRRIPKIKDQDPYQEICADESTTKRFTQWSTAGAKLRE